MNHPSCLEKEVMGWLDELKVQYQREVSIDKYYADFVIDNLVIEVNEAQWHEKEDLRQGQKNRDQNKYRTFIGLSYTVIILPEASIKSGEAKEKIQKLFSI